METTIDGKRGQNGLETLSFLRDEFIKQSTRKSIYREEHGKNIGVHKNRAPASRIDNGPGEVVFVVSKCTGQHRLA